jgi:hypothetical protein
VLLIQAGLTLLTVAMVHCDNPMANRIVLTIFASGVGVAIWLIAANTRPFAGEISVKPNLLLQVMPESGPKGAGP